MPDLWKFTPLHEAAAKGKFDICRLLIQVQFMSLAGPSGSLFGGKCSSGLLSWSSDGCCDCFRCLSSACLSCFLLLAFMTCQVIFVLHAFILFVNAFAMRTQCLTSAPSHSAHTLYMSMHHKVTPSGTIFVQPTLFIGTCTWVCSLQYVHFTKSAGTCLYSFLKHG